MTKAPDIELARVYDDLGATRGARLLVDRLWPRGISKDALKLDEWMKDLAPSYALHKWFGHDPDKWDAFANRYRAELAESQDAVERCLAWCRKGPVVLLYGARDRDRNQAVVLREYLRERLAREEAT